MPPSALSASPSLIPLSVPSSSTAQTGDKGAVALGRSLCSNCRLRTLYLSGNLIREAGARAIARGLSQNPSLTVLHLTGNSIGPEGASALAEGIVVNRTLTKVSEDLLHSGSQSHAVGVWGGHIHIWVTTTTRGEDLCLHHHALHCLLLPAILAELLASPGSGDGSTPFHPPPRLSTPPSSFPPPPSSCTWQAMPLGHVAVHSSSPHSHATKASDPSTW